MKIRGGAGIQKRESEHRIHFAKSVMRTSRQIDKNLGNRSTENDDILP